MSQSLQPSRLHDQQSSRRSDNKIRPQSSYRDKHLKKLMKQYEGYEASQSQQYQNTTLNILSSHLVPLFQALKDQNACLKQQKATIADQFKKLQFVTSTIVQQNEQMKKHCTMRTIDLQKIVQTISLNYGQEQNDLKHRVHLLKEENNIIIKRMNDKMKQDYEIQQQIHQLESNKNQIISTINTDQIKWQQIELRLNQLKSETTALQKKKKQLLTEYQEKNQQVNNLILQNNKFKQQNTDTIFQLKDYSSEIDQNKHKLKNQNYKLHYTILELKKSKKLIEDSLKEKNKRVSVLDEQLKKIKRQVRQKQVLIDKTYFDFSALNQKSVFLQNAIKESQDREKKTISSLNEKNKRKQDLVKQLNIMEIQAEKRKRAQQQGIKQKKQSYYKVIQNLKTNLSRKQVGFSHELNSLDYTIGQIGIQKEVCKKEQIQFDKRIKELEKNLQKSKEVLRQLQKVGYHLRQKQSEIDEIKANKK